jgi:phenylacetate-coenzyme A ligase PaaK-like adenylate-forming protein
MPATATSPFQLLRDEMQSALVASYPELIARTSWSRQQILAHQLDRLRGLLAHAVAHSPFHARRLAGIDIDAVEPDDLSALPVMTKTEMMNEFDDVVTDPRLTHRDVEDELAAAGREPAVLLGSYLALASGGSSGERGVFVLGPAGATEFYGSVTRGLVARIAAMGGPPPGGLPVAIVGASSPVHATGTAQPITAGGPLPFRFTAVPVTLPLPEIVAQLEALQPPALFGYPTILARIAAEQQAGRLRIAPRIVTCTSETCTRELRTAIRDGFGVPLIDSFGSTEGLVGSSPPDDEEIVFAEDGCIIELVDDHNDPVPTGTPSAKILVTNLYNRVQPLIRYAISDRLVAAPAVTEHGYLRARVEGRSDEVFHYSDVDVHPLVVRSVLVATPDVLEYQVRQTATGVDVTAVADHDLDVAGLRGRLAEALSHAGLTRPDVTVRAAPGVARHPQTGKLRRFVPLPRAQSPRAASTVPRSP